MSALSFGVLIASVIALSLFAALLSGNPAGAVTPSVLLLPLDSRPVNTDLPRQLASIADIDVSLPPKDILDQFLTPGKTEGLFEWLSSNEGSGHDATVIFINELLFGSLLHSRDSSQYADAAAKLRLMNDFLIRGRGARGGTLVLVYILPRLLPSQYDDAMWEYEKELPAYSMLKHRISLDPDNKSLSAEILALSDKIPVTILDRYESVFTEAYNTGISLLSWLESGLADEIIIGLDDSAEYGLNVKVFRELKELAGNRDLSGAFFLHGADELAPLIIARHCLSYGQDSEGFTIQYLSEGQEASILPYEAIPLLENFSEKLDYLYRGKVSEIGMTPDAGKESDHGKASDHGKPPGRVAPGQMKHIALFSDSQASTKQLNDVWAGLKLIKSSHKSHAGVLIGLVDIAKINGAWAPLIESAGPDKVFNYIDAYAGWNTAGNSLGNVMAHLMYLEAANCFTGQQRRLALTRHANAQKLRLIDDYFYQSKVRQEFIDWSIKENFHYLTFGGRWMDANAKINEMMNEALEPWPGLRPEPELIRPPSAPKASKGSYAYSFPWPRSFEIKIEAVY